jgi:hypothetical protein
MYLNGVYGAYETSGAPCLEEVLLYDHIIHVPENRYLIIVGFQRWSAALQRKSHLYIPFLGIARPQSKFPHSCVCLLCLVHVMSLMAKPYLISCLTVRRFKAVKCSCFLTWMWKAVRAVVKQLDLQSLRSFLLGWRSSSPCWDIGKL